VSARSRLAARREPQQERSRATRDRILAAAARVLAEHGYARGTTNRIAEAAELSVGSLYQYFPNKDAVLAELVRRHAADGVAAVQASVTAGPVDLESVLGRAVTAMVAVHRGDQRLHRVLFEEAPRPADVLEELRHAEDELVGALAQLVAADADVVVDDARRWARLVVWTVEATVHRAAAAGWLDDPDLPRDITSLALGHLRAGGRT
jgi:AcrR family transcriptional regulator